MQARRLTDTDRRRIKVAGQVAGGVTGAAAGITLLSAGVLLRQAADARRIIPAAQAPPPRGDGLYGPKFTGKTIDMVILGDSSAAGYGVHRPRETPGALLATGVARRLHRPVRLHRLAVVGAVSSGLVHQVDAALEHNPEVAVIMIGGNDVTHITDRAAAVRHLGDAVRRLRAAGCKVVVGTCPDVGAIQPIKPPLRWLARAWSRQLAAEQTIAVVEAGGHTVSMVDLLGPYFYADPVRMFGSDRVHPSVEGYARAAAVIMPTLMAMLGEDDRTPVVGNQGVRSLPEAAQEAVRSAGTEVSAAVVNGHAHGPAGAWARLRRHPWFGEPRSWFGHRDQATGLPGDPADGPAADDGPAAPDVVAKARSGYLWSSARPHLASRTSTRVTRGSGRSASGAVGWTPEDHQPPAG